MPERVIDGKPQSDSDFQESAIGNEGKSDEAKQEIKTRTITINSARTTENEVEQTA